MTRVISIGGAKLPATLLGAGEGNEVGHWESRALLSYHERLLAELDSNWHDWRALEIGRLSVDRRRDIKAEIADLVDCEYGDAPLFVVKDPRICRFAPLFIEALEDARISVRIVHMLRNPLEVAESLERRDRLARTEGNLQWLRHALDSEAATRTCTRVIINYATLLQDCRGVLKSMTEALQIAWPYTIDDILPQVTDFLDNARRHHVRTTEDVLLDPAVGDWVGEAYSALLMLEHNPGSKAAMLALDTIRREFDHAAPVLHRLHAEARLAWDNQLAHLSAVGAKANAEVERLTAALAEQREREVSTLETALADAEIRVRHNIEALEGANQRLEELSATLEQNAAASAKLTAALEVQDKQLAHMSAVGAKANAEVERLTAALAQREREMSSLEARAADLQRLVESKSDQLKRVEGEKSAVVEFSRRAREELIEHFRSSTSWRLTRPLRFLKDLLVEKGFAKRPSAWAPEAKRSSLEPQQSLTLPRQRERGEVSQSTPEPQSGACRPISANVARGPLVTIVVPNYNHETFLHQRLLSVYAQTYSNTEVILLDDCSTDDSRRLLDQFADAYRYKTTTIYNSRNSGSPFHQWIKGIENAKGELVWIAESDDFCAPDYLEKMVTAFEDEAVLLAYGDISFVDERGEILPGVAEYLRQTGYDHWQSAYSRTAWCDFNGAFGVKNIITNVSGAVFRRPTLSDAIKRKLVNYRVCGDWLFYMDIARGGKIAYVPEAKAHFRQHLQNSSGAPARGESYYREHEDIGLELRRIYGADEQIIRAQYRSLAETYGLGRGVHNNRFALEDQYSLSRVISARREKLRILIGSLGFYSGGGEALPIYLANALHEAGHAVTFFALGYEAPPSSSIRAKLHSGIAIVDRQGVRDGLADFAFDVINTHNIGLEYFFCDLQAAQNIPYVVTHHGSYEVSEATQRDLRDFDRFVDRWVYIADKNCDRFRAAGCFKPEKFTKLSNGAPVDAARPADLAQFDIGKDDFVLVTASRAIPEKGWRHAIRSVEAANRQSSRRITLLLVGDGQVHEELLHEGPKWWVRLLGHRDDVGGLYASAHCALLPSYFAGESNPLTLIESLQRGKPCIAPDIGEIRNMLTDENGCTAGIVVPAKSSEESFESDLTQAIVKLVNDRESYARACTLASEIKHRYAIGQMVERYEAIFRDEIKRKLGRRLGAASAIKGTVEAEE
jgi:glycosyltransferase involved in cell wall biosynthesis